MYTLVVVVGIGIQNQRRRGNPIVQINGMVFVIGMMIVMGVRRHTADIVAMSRDMAPHGHK